MRPLDEIVELLGFQTLGRIGMRRLPVLLSTIPLLMLMSFLLPELPNSRSKFTFCSLGQLAHGIPCHLGSLRWCHQLQCGHLASACKKD
eukprot:1335301-Karenia_brevis.AAC.1